MLQFKRWRRFCGLVPVLAALLLLPLAGGLPALAAPSQAGYPTDRVPDPHQAGVQYFAPTGHTLRGPILAYWQRYGGLTQFGYPITEQFVEAGPTAHLPYTVQYFQRTRFELHPESRDPNFQVLLGRLGVEFHTPEPAVSAQANPVSHYFQETGHNVGPLFYTYWAGHGGVFVNGFPISEAKPEVNPIDGHTYTVQYFERARFEAHPEAAGTPYEVQLGLLGTQLAQKQGYFPPTTAYPAFGHAGDFTWIAGQVAVTRIQGGCVFVHYGDAGDQVQPIGAGWDTVAAGPLGAQGAQVVLFGHWANPTDPHPQCPGRNYVVDRVQANPQA